MQRLINKALLLSFILLSATANAYSDYDFEVDGIYYCTNGNQATVTYGEWGGEGEIYPAYSGDVIIPETVTYNGVTYSVTGIGDKAFIRCNLNTVTIPSSVTRISSLAFFLCSIGVLEIPNTVASFDEGAFCGTYINQLIWNIPSCPGLYAYIDYGDYDYPLNASSVIIGDSVKSIPENFLSGSDITRIILPNSVTTIGEHAFNNSSLKSVTIPNSVTTIGYDAFSSCPLLTNVSIYGTFTGSQAFSFCPALTTVNINVPVTEIAYCAFIGCPALSNIFISNSVTTINEGAFYGCNSLKDINIPNSVKTIGDWAFSDCTGLSNIYIGKSVSTIGNTAFAGSSANQVYCYAVTPPVCDDNTFSNYSATLHVPAASLAAYFTAPCWRNFENIVGDAVAPTGIVISHDSIEMQLGEQVHLIATILPNSATNKEVKWLSTDTTVATVDNGTVTATSYGECDIIASCFGMQAICHISVTNRITLEQQEAMLLPNHMLTLTPTAPTMPDGFTVTSSEPTVAAARVMNGKVQVVGIKEGTTTITVGSIDGNAIPATCLVTVYTERGDVNMDGFVTINDVTQIIDYLLSGDDTNIKLENADVNGNGNVSIGDVTALIDKLLSGN